MNQCKVVQAFIFNNGLHGLTDEGHLVRFDMELNKWSFRGSNEVLSSENSVLLRSESFKAPEYVVTIPKKESLFKRFLRWFLSQRW